MVVLPPSSKGSALLIRVEIFNEGIHFENRHIKNCGGFFLIHPIRLCLYWIKRNSHCLGETVISPHYYALKNKKNSVKSLMLLQQQSDIFVETLQF